MTRRLRISFLVAVLLMSGTVLSQNTPPRQEPKRGPSTAEERARFVALTHKLEQAPLDKSLYPDKKWALQWIDDIPDINVTPCLTVLGEDFLVSRYKYAANVEVQVIFGNVVYLIEHPDKKNDSVAQYTAGVESALKTYKSILRADPVISKELEELLQKQTQGKLAEFVRESSKECRAQGDQT